MDNQQKNINDSWSLLLKLINLLVIILVCALIYLPLKPFIQSYLNRPQYNAEQLKKMSESRQKSLNDDWDYVDKGIHVKTGMVFDDNFKHIRSHCLSCHSSKLITQNRADRAGWKSMIRWMQSTQGLHDLGESEPYILDYLSKHYAPKETGRRPNINIEDLEWYVLELVK